MTFLRRVDGAEERMDAPDVDARHLEAALDDVTAVNRWLGGRRALLRHLDAALPAGRHRVLDVGTGAGDLPRAIAERERARPVRITAVDLHPRTLEAARRRSRPGQGLLFARADGLRLPFRDGAFDLALLSMTLHHMNGDAQVAILRELARVARGGRVLVGELERSVPSYAGARFLGATLWRRNPITRHDGPLSVLRSFTPAELRDLATRAGLREPRVHRHAFFRLVLLADA
ncbi:MAG TPA: methyltransferase domain-containing protein [Longimicrobiales bacterium]|nr:methyltransferase domain-containing protein [Longimicrobiales bacterium]